MLWEDGSSGTFRLFRSTWPRPGEKSVAGVSWLAAWRRAEVSSETGSELGSMLDFYMSSVLGPVGICAQDSLDRCQPRPRHGLVAISGAPKPKHIPDRCLRVPPPRTKMAAVQP